MELNGVVPDQMVVLDSAKEELPRVLALVSSESGDEPEMMDAFTLKGRTWRIRTAARVNVGLKYLHILRVRGWSLGRDYMLSALLEPGAYDALLDFDDLTAEQFDEVVDLAATVMLGKVDAPN